MQITVNNPINGLQPVVSGSQIRLIINQDATGGRPGPLFSTTSPGGFEPDLNNLAIVGDPLTRSIYTLSFDGTVWSLTAFQTGETI